MKSLVPLVITSEGPQKRYIHRTTRGQRANAVGSTGECLHEMDANWGGPAGWIVYQILLPTPVLSAPFSLVGRSWIWGPSEHEVALNNQPFQRMGNCVSYSINLPSAENLTYNFKAFEENLRASLKILRVPGDLGPYVEKHWSKPPKKKKIFFCQGQYTMLMCLV